jgi:3-phosphoshikimate 1-carboxyvinyltransferase
MTGFPDILEIRPLERPPDCVVTAPGSKSITNRALILAARSPQRCTLRGALWADDTAAMVESLRRLGFAIEVSPDPAEPANRTIVVEGRGGEIPARAAELHVGAGGTTARFLAALVASGRGRYRLDGDEQLRRRPMRELFDALRRLGARVDGERLPVTIEADGLARGPVTVSARESSQFASALRLVDVEVRLAEADEALAYLEMTERMRREFRADYAIEPDLSSASYLVAAGFICRGRVQVAGWPDNSLQPDGRFPRYLPPPAQVSRRTDLGDSIMTLAVCALFGPQPTRLVEAGRLRLQECDRIRALATELQRVGARVVEHADGLTVWPAEPGRLHGADIETYQDHRMAMCLAVLGLKLPGIRIRNPGCVAKSFPNFYAKLEELRR